MEQSSLIAIEIAVVIFIIIPTVIAFIFGAPFVPTPMAAAEKMIELTGIQKGKKLYDMGCGDGRCVYIAANKYDADAVGIELTPWVYLIARIRKFLWKSKAILLMQNFRSVNISDADAVIFYLLPDSLKLLRQKLEKELKPGCRVVSYAFEIAGWKPVYVEPKKPEQNITRILVYEIGKT
ncbi:MAG: hypothetical protein AAB592_01820 [Patescibacteria group bacterium]